MEFKLELAPNLKQEKLIKVILKKATMVYHWSRILRGRHEMLRTDQPRSEDWRAYELLDLSAAGM